MRSQTKWKLSLTLNRLSGVASVGVLLFQWHSKGSIRTLSTPNATTSPPGLAQIPTPAIAINFKTFTTDPSNPFQPQVEIADTTLQQSQEMYSSFGRGDTFNTMIAIAPDFKQGYVDTAR